MFEGSFFRMVAEKPVASMVIGLCSVCFFPVFWFFVWTPRMKPFSIIGCVTCVLSCRVAPVSCASFRSLCPK